MKKLNTLVYILCLSVFAVGIYSCKKSYQCTQQHVQYSYVVVTPHSGDTVYKSSLIDKPTRKAETDDKATIKAKYADSLVIVYKDTLFFDPSKKSSGSVDATKADDGLYCFEQ